MGRRTGGSIGFGFARKDQSWAPREGQTKSDRPDVPASQVQREQEALKQAIIDLAAQVTDLSKVARRWNELGLKTVKGHSWTTKAVRATLERPALAGMIAYDGQIVFRNPEGGIAAAEDYQRLQTVFAGRRQGAPPGRRYIGSGYLKCSMCGTGLSGRPQGKTHKDDGTPRTQYYCNRERRGCGKVYADGRSVDTQLRLFTIAKLSDIRHVQALTAATEEKSNRLAEIKEKIDKKNNLRKALRERAAREEITLEEFDEMNQFLNADLEPLQNEYDTLVELEIVGPGKVLSVEDVAQAWDSGELAEKRELLAQACGTGELRVRPDPQNGARAFNKERIKWSRRNAPYEDKKAKLTGG